jgi:hypothetical protein
MEGHGDGAIVGGGGQTRGSSSASGSGDTTLGGSLWCLRTCGSTTGGTATCTSSKSIEKTTLGTSRSATSTSHEHGDSGTSVNSAATLSASKSRGLATHLAGSDDGSISLRTAEGRSAVTRCTILDY